MLAYLKLFRWPNLVMIAIIQYLTRYAIIVPMLQQQGFYPVLSDVHFAMLVLSTLFMAAAGYTINDYFDLRTDRINKPHKIILGKKISRRTAILYHTLLNISGVLLGIYLSLIVGRWPLILVFLFIPTLLWMYSIRYKKKFLSGNLLVSFLSALTVFIVWAFEYHALGKTYSFAPETLATTDLTVKVFAMFAFITSLSREVIKDVEDIRGDAKTGCKTIPIVSGIRKTKIFLVSLQVIIMVFVAIFQYLLLVREFDLLFIYLFFFIQIPQILVINNIIRAREKVHYSILSGTTKWVMISGVFSMLFIYLYFQKGYML